MVRYSVRVWVYQLFCVEVWPLKDVSSCLLKSGLDHERPRGLRHPAMQAHPPGPYFKTWCCHRPGLPLVQSQAVVPWLAYLLVA